MYALAVRLLMSSHSAEWLNEQTKSLEMSLNCIERIADPLLLASALNANLHFTYAVLQDWGANANVDKKNQIAGPMWSGPIHNKEFVEKVLSHLDKNEKNYGTATRMRGMLTVAKEVRAITQATGRVLVSDPLVSLIGTHNTLLFYTHSHSIVLPLHYAFAG
jgi:tRNA G26 N,N-dimethylase Trm1